MFNPRSRLIQRARRRHLRLVSVSCLVLCACTGVRAAPAAGGPRPQRRIEYRDLARYLDQNLYGVVERLVPTALHSRRVSLLRTPLEAGPHVYINGAFAGDVSVLREIQVATVYEVRLLAPLQLGFWYPRQNPHGAIDVILRR